MAAPYPCESFSWIKYEADLIYISPKRDKGISTVPVLSIPS